MYLAGWDSLRRRFMAGLAFSSGTTLHESAVRIDASRSPALLGADFMSRLSVALVLSTLTLNAVIASSCSKQPASPANRGVPHGVNPVCDRHLLKIEDLAGLLNVPITDIRPLPGDEQSCEFATATFPGIVISVRPGVGRITVQAWQSGKMPLHSDPLPDVGDAAVWQETLHEVVAEKNAVLCDIQIRGGGSDLAISAKALPAALGALCNKIFAAI